MRATSVGVMAVCVALGPGAVLAQAACPTAQDLARGIRIDFADGSSETFRDQGAGVVTVQGVDVEGFGYVMELGKGIHLLSYAPMTDGVIDEGARLDYDYGLAIADMPVPEPGGRWSTSVTVTDSMGPRSEPQSHAWGTLGSVDIGGCRYDMIEALIAYKTADNYVESVLYLPALGIGYLLWNESSQTERFPVEAVAISVARKK